MAEISLPSCSGMTKRTEKMLADEVAAFVVSKIRSSAFFINIPVRLLLILFEAGALITVLKPFSLSNPRDRRVHMRMALKIPMLGFDKLILFTRNLMLLYYYDHPMVRIAIQYESPGPDDPEGVC